MEGIETELVIETPPAIAEEEKEKIFESYLLEQMPEMIGGMNALAREIAYPAQTLQPQHIR